MALKDRVARLEANTQVSPHINAVTWWRDLLANPKENEHRINAAICLAFDCLIQKPPAHLWQPLEDSTKATWDELPNSLYGFLAFYSLAYCEEGDEEMEAEIREVFADEDGKEFLCGMATVYWEVFKTAPLVPLPEVEKYGAARRRVVALARLRRDFIIPLFELIFTGPPYGYSYARFESWLDKEGECESLLQSARDYMFGDKAK